MSNVEAGHVFSTGNSTVAELPVGTILAVSGQGELEVIEIGEDEAEPVEVVPGVEFTSKRGIPAFVVDLTSTGGLRSAGGDNVFYVEDGVNRVRRTSKEFVQDNLL